MFFHRKQNIARTGLIIWTLFYFSNKVSKYIIILFYQCDYPNNIGTDTCTHQCDVTPTGSIGWMSMTSSYHCWTLDYVSAEGCLAEHWDQARAAFPPHGWCPESPASPGHKQSNTELWSAWNGLFPGSFQYFTAYYSDSPDDRQWSSVVEGLVVDWISATRANWKKARNTLNHRLSLRT